MSKVWPQDKIRELIALAEAQGISRADLSSPREAELFRFAIYNFRRENDIGDEIIISIEDSSVVLTLRVRPQVTISQEAAQ